MKSFLDDDFQPADPAAFEAGRQAERDRANSPEEKERWDKITTEIGHQIAEGFKKSFHQ